MNKGAVGIIGIGVFVFLCGYITTSEGIMGTGAVVLLAGFCLLIAKNRTIDKDTGKPFYKCPNCGGNSGKEIPKDKQENGKEYKCIVCGYKW